MLLTTSVALLLLGKSFAAKIEKRQSCPPVHVFGARETTVGPGFGTSAGLVNQVLAAYPGATSEALTYPACGGQASCGGISYANSVGTGTNNAASAINSFNQRCPSTKIVLIGYSQGGEVFDNCMCGGPDGSYTSSAVPLTAAAVNMVKAAIFLGDPHNNYNANLPYQVGTCRASGFAARPAGFSCPNASKCKLYCDSQDPYCCNGNDANHHQQYVSIYGSQAMQFIRQQLDASGPGPTTTGGGPGTTSPPTTSTPSGSNCSAKWGQCGGQSWTGPTCCQSGSTCQAQNQWYSQCL